jgi:hypothetical protein
MKSIPTKIKVFVAAIKHEHGLNLYLGDTRKAVDLQLFEFVKEYVNDLADPVACQDAIDSNNIEAAIGAYFDEHPSEFLEVQNQSEWVHTSLSKVD